MSNFFYTKQQTIQIKSDRKTVKMKAENVSAQKKRKKNDDDDDDRGEKAQFVPTRLSRP